MDNKLDQYLSIYVYDKIWSVLPKNEKELLMCFDKGEMSTEELLNKIPYDGKSYSVYRERLIKRGLLVSSGHGKISFTLPGFLEFVLKNNKM